MVTRTRLRETAKWIGVVLGTLVFVGCEAPAPQRINSWRDYRLGHVEYDGDADELHITVERGTFAESLRVRRMSTSSGLAVDPTGVWAPKMWPHANLTVHGASGLKEPGWVAFELFEWPDKVWQRVRLEITPPPELSVSDGRTTIVPRRRPQHSRTSAAPGE